MTIKRKILLNPGPATTTNTVKMAQVVSDICPREKEFGDVMRYISSTITQIAGGDENYVTVLFTGSGTSVVDAAINSIVPEGKKILIINNGAYGKRMVDIAKAYSIDCIELEYGWGHYPDIEEIERKLKEEKDIACIGMIHHETTTGMLNPVREVGALSKKYNTLFIVDTISSFAGIPFNIQEYAIDFMMSTSNKCIQECPDVPLLFVKRPPFFESAKNKKRSFYLNLYQQYAYFEKSGQMQFTPPVQVLYSLKKAIEEFLEETSQGRYGRYAKNWEVLTTGMKELGFRKLLPDSQESKILTTYHYPDHANFNFDTMHDLLFEKDFTIYPGKIGSKKTFRLANMGDITEEDMKNFCIALKEVLKEMKVEM